MDSSQSRQATSKTLTNGLELPFAIVQVQLAEDHGGFHGRIFGQVEAGKFYLAFVVGHADEGVGDHAEVLLALISFVDAKAPQFPRHLRALK